MAIFSLHTERLDLKVLDESYSELVLQYLSKNRNFHKPFVPERADYFYTDTFQSNHLKHNQRLFHLKRSIRFHLFRKHQPKQIIGDLAFDNIILGSFLSCYLGYQMDEEEVNQGYMTEGLKKGIEFIFESVGLHRIEANIMPSNERSARVVKKLGFTNEGSAKDYLKINGKWEDHNHWVLLNDRV
ncbi:MAG: GNAT family N-acetyltransferase [Chitinophagales bacterium]|nr:GNAT family N-acetyltransferase [Chitinophagales bacterium]